MRKKVEVSSPEKACERIDCDSKRWSIETYNDNARPYMWVTVSAGVGTTLPPTSKQASMPTIRSWGTLKANGLFSPPTMVAGFPPLCDRRRAHGGEVEMRHQLVFTVTILAFSGERVYRGPEAISPGSAWFLSMRQGLAPQKATRGSRSLSENSQYRILANGVFSTYGTKTGKFGILGQAREEKL